MPREVLAALEPRPGRCYVDGTLGGGGHTRLLAERVGEQGKIIALDRDVAACERARRELAGLPVIVVQANFADLREVLDDLVIDRVDGVLLDLGLSSDQLADRERGFSFDSPGPLDLRFDTSQGRPAWEILATCREKELADWIFQYGEERYSRRIARAVVENRRAKPIRTAEELAQLVRRCVPRPKHAHRGARGRQSIDPATRTFQALRILVNDELGSLQRILNELPACLRAGGRAVIISFHSLEDRLAKQAFRQRDVWRSLYKKPLQPADDELQTNPRSRSAKLRAAELVRH